MKKLCGILSLALLLIVAGCHRYGHCATSGVNEPAKSPAQTEPLRVVASTFPVWLFTANIIAGTPVELQLLVPAAVGCPHDFALKPADLGKLTGAQVVVINGGGLEGFLDKPLAELKPRPQIIDASEGLKFLKTSGGAINPHIFASPLQAAAMVANIARHLGAADPAHREQFSQNAKSMEQTLLALSAHLQKIGANASNKGIAIEHDALAYLTADAGLEIVAELQPGASAAQMAALKKLLLEKKPGLLAGDAQYPDKLLQTLAVETMLPYANLNTCASGPEKAPRDYYQTAMQGNMKILEQHFGK